MSPKAPKRIFMKYKKILFTGHSLSTFAPSIFKNLHYFADEVTMFDHYSPDMFAKIIGLIKNKLLYLKEFERKFNDYINYQFEKTVNKNQPNIIFLFKCKNIYPETLIKLRTKGFLVINWYPDYYDDWQWIKNHAQNYDFFFTPCMYVLSELKKIGIRSYYIPFATQTDKFFPTSQKIYQATFVGRFTRRRNILFKKVFDAGMLDIWGYHHWQKSHYNQRFHGEVTPIEALEIIRRSKITLNTLTGTDAVPIESVNYRVFEATGVGGFVLSWFHTPLEKFFRIGKEIEIFKTAGEAAEKTSYYLRNESIRNKIARAGWERTRKNHSYQVRLKQLFSFVK